MSLTHLNINNIQLYGFKYSSLQLSNIINLQAEVFGHWGIVPKARKETGLSAVLFQDIFCFPGIIPT